MSVEVEKVSVFDDRIIQPQPVYAVEKGALALTNVPFSAITNTTTQLTFNIIVPSENVFVDRAVDLSVTIRGTCQTQLGTQIAGTPIFPPGTIAPAPFPLQQIATSIQATINDATVVINTVDVLPQVLRLTDYKAHRLQRTCPTALDNYASYSDTVAMVAPALAFSSGVFAAPTSAGSPTVDLSTASSVVTTPLIATNSPLGVYNNARNSDELGNGSFPGFSWLGSAANATSTFSGPADDSVGTNSATAPVASFVNGWPVVRGPLASTEANSTFLYWQIVTTEKLVLSPFIFGDAYEYDTGLFGVQNIQLVLNINPNNTRILRHAPLARAVGADATAVTSSTLPSPIYNVNVTSFVNPRVQVQFLTPSLDVSLPAKSVIPYTEFPRYITTLGDTLAGLTAYATGAPGKLAAAYASPSVTTVQTNTITLPLIPDLLMVYVRPANYNKNPATGNNYSGFVKSTTTATSSGGDQRCVAANYTLPIQGISVNFDNFAGLLSSHTQEQLYKMSVANGIEMDYPTFCGFTETGLYQGGGAVSAGTSNASVWVPSVGPILLLKPGRDIPLQAGQAPGLVGNFSLQMSLRIYNNSLISYSANELQIYVVTINSGFFETIKGSSRLIKGLLTEQDIISAPEADAMTSGQVSRLVGSGAKVQNILSRLKKRLGRMREGKKMGKGKDSEMMEHSGKASGSARSAMSYYQ